MRRVESRSRAQIIARTECVTPCALSCPRSAPRDALRRADTLAEVHRQAVACGCAGVVVAMADRHREMEVVVAVTADRSSRQLRHRRPVVSPRLPLFLFEKEKWLVSLAVSKRRLRALMTPCTPKRYGPVMRAWGPCFSVPVWGGGNAHQEGSPGMSVNLEGELPSRA